MAHTCPDCGQMCYCGGDFDDCCFDTTTDQDKCSHCWDDDSDEPDGTWDEGDNDYPE